MHVELEEGPRCYASKVFAYRAWYRPTTSADVDNAYTNGFLPESEGNLTGTQRFYKARSLRVALAHYHADKDARYVLRKIEPMGLRFSVYPREVISQFRPSVIEQLHEHSTERFRGGEVFTPARCEWILRHPLVNQLAVVHTEGHGPPAGFIILIRRHSMVHGWFSTRRRLLIAQPNLGRWMLLQLVTHAIREGLEYVYMGTVYGQAARYKILPGSECHYGSVWSSDLARLRDSLRQDDAAEGHTIYRAVEKERTP